MIKALFLTALIIHTIWGVVNYFQKKPETMAVNAFFVGMYYYKLITE